MSTNRRAAAKNQAPTDANACAGSSARATTRTWADWRWQMRHRLTRLEHFEAFLELTDAERLGLAMGAERFAVSVTPHFAALMDPADPNCPIRRQVVPTAEEFVVSAGDMEDPCGEDHASVVEGLVHRYPDRVLLLALDTCASYCRYCTRSRLVSQGALDPLPRRMEGILEYLREHTEVRDVLLSGGDPLLMSDDRLDACSASIREIEHIELLRIGSRVPGFLPQRITPELVAVLRRHRVWLSLHFSHPAELTPEVAAACDLLADAGIPLGSQTVLLRGINDDAEIAEASSSTGCSRSGSGPTTCTRPTRWSAPATCAPRSQRARDHEPAARPHQWLRGAHLRRRRSWRRRQDPAPARDRRQPRRRRLAAPQLGRRGLHLRRPAGRR